MTDVGRKIISLSASRCLCLGLVLGMASWTSGCALPGSGSSDPHAQSEAPTSGLPIPADVDPVLPASSVLIAHTAAGRIKIDAGPGSLRVLSWEGARRSVVTKPREKPFPGTDSIGLHYDGKPPSWKPYKGIDKVHYEENSRDFTAPIDPKIWTQIRRLYFSYNNHGVAVGWKRDGDTLHVEVWQFYINGKKPTQLPGADDQAVMLKTKAESDDLAENSDD